MQINIDRLRTNGTYSLSGVAPWVPIQTFAAANYLKVHQKTLLEWHKQSIGPEPEPREAYLGNQLYWMPSRLRAWWEELVLDRPRTEDQIIADWKVDCFWWEDFEWPMPQKPKGRHLRRRRRIARQVLRTPQ
jgi:hypothetical protein